MAILQKGRYKKQIKKRKTVADCTDADVPISMASAMLFRYANAIALTISMAEGIHAMMVIPAKEGDTPMAVTAAPST
jgi:hypothetical protein